MRETLVAAQLDPQPAHTVEPFNLATRTTLTSQAKEENTRGSSTKGRWGESDTRSAEERLCSSGERTLFPCSNTCTPYSNNRIKGICS